MTQRMGEEMAFALALEGRVAPRGETAQLLALAGVLEAFPEPEIDADFAAALEARLMNEMQDERPVVVARPQLRVVPAFPATPADEVVRSADVVRLPRRRMVVRRSIAAAVAAASLAAFPLAAAASSLPGSPFYGIKKAVEHAEIVFTGDSVADGLAYARFAERRMGEVSQLAALGADSGLIARTADESLADLRTARSLVLGHTTDPAVLRRLGDIARATEHGVPSAGVLAPGARAAVAAAVAASRQIQAAVADALGLSPVPTPEVAAASDTVVLSPVVADLPAERIAESATVPAAQPDESTPARTTEPEPTKPSGHGKAVTDAGEACSVPGSANGLSDLAAPVTRIFCG